MKEMIQEALGRRGYRLERITSDTIDVRSLGNHPACLRYHGRPVLVAAPRALGRGKVFLSLSADGPHPFVRAVTAGRKAAARGDALSVKAITTHLQGFYDTVQPRTLGERFALAPDDCAAELASAPPNVELLPWHSWSLSTRMAERVEKARGGRWPGWRNQPVAGWSSGGPASVERIHRETERLHRLGRSILASGYRRDDGPDGDVVAVALLREGDWRWQVRSGQHRAAVAAAVGIDPLPVRIVALIDRRDVSVWPQVASGVYTVEGALRMFDRVFDAAATPAYDQALYEA